MGCGQSASQSQIDKSKVAQSRLQLGLAYLAENQYKLARQNLALAVEFAPDDYRTQLAMALYAQQTGEHEMVERYYQQALRLSPGNGTVLNNYGAFLCTLGRYELAQQQFSAVIKSPDHRQLADSLENSGYCYLKANQLEQAKKTLTRAIRNDHDKGRALLVETERLLEEKNTNQPRMLLAIYEQVLPLNAQSLWLHIRLSVLDGNVAAVQRYGQQLAQYFPQSQQHRQFLANEY